MKALVALVALAATAVLADDLHPSCNRPIYCDSKLLHYVQMNRIASDSKTFVDLHMKTDEDTILTAFDDLLNDTNNNPTKQQLINFVDEYFDSTSELESWTPPDYSEDPKFLDTITDETLRQYAKDINAIWPILAKKVKPEIFQNQSQYSLIPVTHGFIIPGGRFTELYYWDTYWIIEGLLVTGMETTAKGMIENLFELLRKIGLVPNGSRWYYQERSQPPLLSAMVALYYKYTKDEQFLKDNIDALELELRYWQDTQIVTFNKDDRVFTLLRYYAPSKGPRPESYYEDYTNAQYYSGNDPQDFYTDIKSAAESGWDFSSRWFISPKGDDSGNLTNIQTKNIIPVDLNSIFANALSNVAYFHSVLGNTRESTHYGFLAKQWRSTINDVLWNDDDGIWYDYDIANEKHRKYFYTSNVAPLWLQAVEQTLVSSHGSRVLNYLLNSTALDYAGGIPTSLQNTGEQWDLPNVWPPEVGIVINALENIKSENASERAFELAQSWVRACLKGFTKNKQMFEKYDAYTPGQFGGGGEYNVQSGFGWSNGVVLEFLSKYGRRMTANDSAEDEKLLEVVPIELNNIPKKNLDTK